MERTSLYQVAALSPNFGGDDDFIRAIFYALLSEGYDDLDEIIETINREKYLPDDFQTDLVALQGYRQYYGRRLSDYTLEQRLMLKAFDGRWTEELVRRMMGFDEPSFENALPVPKVQ